MRNNTSFKKSKQILQESKENNNIRNTKQLKSQIQFGMPFCNVNNQTGITVIILFIQHNGDCWSYKG